jgi:hypothetical protein
MSAVAAATIGSAIIGAGVSISASKKASKAQIQAADRTADEQRAAREEMRAYLAPYTSAGTPALQAQMAALGLAGPEEQQAYVSQQEQSPIFQALARQQEEAILQNASATGGLRGGNVQGALAQFRPALLNQFLDQQYERLGGLTRLGQASAAGVGASGITSATNIGQAYTQAGQAQAGGILGQANAFNQAIGTIGGQLPGLFKPPAPPVGVPTPSLPPPSGMIGPNSFNMFNTNQRTI